MTFCVNGQHVDACSRSGHDYWMPDPLSDEMICRRCAHSTHDADNATPWTLAAIVNEFQRVRCECTENQHYTADTLRMAIEIMTLRNIAQASETHIRQLCAERDALHEELRAIRADDCRLGIP